MRIRSFAVMVLLVGMSAPFSAPAQQVTTVIAPVQPADTFNARRPMVTRANLQAALDELQRGLSSTGYSPAIRTTKQAEADVIRDRLAEGDFRPADQVKVDILGEPGLSTIYSITPTRTLTLPGGAEIQMRGILRSEVQAYLTKEFKRYVNDPSLTTTAYIRISMFGALAKPGFFQAPATALLSEEIMRDAGGPTDNVRWDKSTIKRGDRIIVDGPAFQVALRQGLTLDQLNVQAGDEIDLAAKPSSGLFWRIVAATTGLGGLVYLLYRIF